MNNIDEKSTEKRDKALGFILALALLTLGAGFGFFMGYFLRGCS